MVTIYVLSLFGYLKFETNDFHFDNIAWRIRICMEFIQLLDIEKWRQYPIHFSINYPPNQSKNGSLVTTKVNDIDND